MGIRVNALTTEGEKVVIISKEITDGARPFESQILKSEDGRTFKPAGGGQVMEVTIMDADEQEFAPATGATIEEIPEPDAEQAAEAPAAGGEEEADS